MGGPRSGGSREVVGRHPRERQAEGGPSDFSAVRGGERGPDGGRSGTALSAVEALEAGADAAANLGALAGVKLRGGKQRNWGEGELDLVKEAIKVARGLAQAELKRGIVTLELGPADERLAGILLVLRDAFGGPGNLRYGLSASDG